MARLELIRSTEGRGKRWRAAAKKSIPDVFAATHPRWYEAMLAAYEMGAEYGYSEAQREAGDRPHVSEVLVGNDGPEPHGERGAASGPVDVGADVQTARPGTE